MMTKKYVTTEKVALTYYSSEIDPRKRTIVFFHGLSADHRLFRDQVAYFKDDYNIITWDAPGHGDSKDAPSYELDVAAQAIEAILDKEGVTKAILVGQSFGGYHAQSFMLRYPERVEAFIGIGTSPYGNYYSKLDFFLLRKASAMVSGLDYRSLKEQVAKSVSLTTEGQKLMLEMLENLSHEEYAHLLQESYDAFIRDNRELEIKVPMLLLLGEKDKTGKVAKYNKKWQKKTGAPLVKVKDASHNANVDNHDEVNGLIHKFLKKEGLE